MVVSIDLKLLEKPSNKINLFIVISPALVTHFIVSKDCKLPINPVMGDRIPACAQLAACAALKSLGKRHAKQGELL